MGDEFKDVSTDRPIMVTFTPDWEVGKPEGLAAIFGFDGSKADDPRHSVMFETTNTVSGRPPYPQLIESDAPWWQWRYRRAIRQTNEDRIRDWELACRDWEAAGKPDREVLVRTYIPNARITEGDS